MNQLLAGMLTTALLTAYLPADAAPSQSWTLDGNVLTVTGTGQLSPDVWDFPVEDVREVILAEGITGIRAGALSGFVNMQTLTLPESLVTLAPRALEGSTALTEIRGLEHVTGFGYRCLTDTGCMAQMPFVITDGKLYYAECSDLHVPDGVTEIMPFAFGNLTDAYFLQTDVQVTLPDSVTVIGDNAFAFCTSLTMVTPPAHLQRIGSRAFYSCARLQSLSLPESVESIGEQAFFNCRSLGTLTVPNPEAAFGEDVFGICYDWEQAVISRRDSYPSEASYEQALAALEAAPCSMDDALTHFALHSPEDRSYTEISFSDSLTVPYLKHTGTLCAYAGTPAQTYADSSAVSFTALSVLPGDVNLDGSVNIMDVILLNKYLIRSAKLTAPSRTAADLNEDGDLSARDALSVLKLCLT